MALRDQVSVPLWERMPCLLLFSGVPWTAGQAGELGIHTQSQSEKDLEMMETGTTNVKHSDWEPQHLAERNPGPAGWRAWV